MCTCVRVSYTKPLGYCTCRICIYVYICIYIFTHKLIHAYVHVCMA